LIPLDNKNHKPKGGKSNMSYQEIFDIIKEALSNADTSGIDNEFALQIYIEGEGEGTFYIAYKGGTLEVEPYDYIGYCAILSADKDTLINIFSGKLDILKAVSDGKYIEGDIKAIKCLQKFKYKKK
jgi:putative sterol carrier protein